METTSYGLCVELPGLTLEEGVTQATAALAEVGFGVLNRIDVDTTLKEKIGADFRPYSILGACHPHLALEALGADEQVGLLMPCNVVIQESRSGINISAIDPEKLAQLVDNKKTHSVMVEAASLLRRALKSLVA